MHCTSNGTMIFSSNPPGKRPKVHDFLAFDLSEKFLPAELWGHIMNYLPLSDVIQCSAVSPFMLKEVMPRVRHLSVFKKGGLRATVARRFGTKNMKQIDIYCLINCVDPNENEEKFSLCQKTASCIVPFLCNFPNLRSVGLDVDPVGIPLGTYFHDTFTEADSVEVVRSLVRSICGAYQNGSFSQQLQIYGPAFQAGTFICYKSHGCSLCKMYCESFPVEQAVNARATCISVSERLQIIANRPGGTIYLKSKALILELLRSNYEVPFLVLNSNNSFKTEQAKLFSKTVIEELEILCTKFFDTNTLTHDEVIDALASEDEWKGDRKIWLVQQCYEKLTSLGIPVNKTFVSLVGEKVLLSDLHHYM